MRAETDKILLEAAAAGASLEDLQAIAAAAIEQWRSRRPDPADDFDFPDRYVRLGLTFGGAGTIRGDLTPECAAALNAVLEALGNRQGPEDDRNEGQRLRDALTIPIVTGHADMNVINKIIALVLASPGGNPSSPASARMLTETRQELRYAIARLAVDFISGPGSLASALRTGLLEHPYSTPSLPLDIGVSGSIPGQIRRAVILRDQHCAWLGGCDRPASACDVHHLKHKSNGGETSVHNCGILRISP